MKILNFLKSKTNVAGLLLIGFAVLGFFTGELDSITAVGKAAEGLGLIGIRHAISKSDVALIAAVLNRAKKKK